MHPVAPICAGELRAVGRSLGGQRSFLADEGRREQLALWKPEPVRSTESK